MMQKTHQLAQFVIFLKQNNCGIIGLGSNQKVIEDINFWKTLVEISYLFIDGLIIEEAWPDINKRNDEEMNKALDFLLSNNFIVPFSITENSRYNRTNLYYQSVGGNPANINQKLESAQVSIIGCGGIGNHVAAMLACNGVGKICLIDSDVIELSNLTRQILFTEKSVGKFKVDVLAEEIHARNSEIIVKKLNLMISSSSDFDQLDHRDLFIISADSPGLVKIANQYCIQNNIPFINIGYLNDISTYGPFVIPKISGCINCGLLRLEISTDTDINKKIDIINKRFRSATFPPVNAVSAAMATSDIIKFFAGIGDIKSLNKRIGLYDSTLKIETQGFSLNPECHICFDSKNIN